MFFFGGGGGGVLRHLAVQTYFEFEISGPLVVMVMINGFTFSMKMYIVVLIKIAFVKGFK